MAESTDESQEKVQEKVCTISLSQVGLVRDDSSVSWLGLG